MLVLIARPNRVDRLKHIDFRRGRAGMASLDHLDGLDGPRRLVGPHGPDCPTSIVGSKE